MPRELHVHAFCMIDHDNAGVKFKGPACVTDDARGTPQSSQQSCDTAESGAVDHRSNRSGSTGAFVHRAARCGPAHPETARGPWPAPQIAARMGCTPRARHAGGPATNRSERIDRPSRNRPKESDLPGMSSVLRTRICTIRERRSGDGRQAPVLLLGLRSQLGCDRSEILIRLGAVLASLPPGLPRTANRCEPRPSRCVPSSARIRRGSNRCTATSSARRADRARGTL